MTNDARARELIDLLARQQYADAAGRFDDTMKAALPADKLEQVWGALQGQVGRFQGIAGSRSETRDAHGIVHVTCTFEKTSLDAKIVFDREHRIAGLFFVPTQEPSAKPDDRGTPPPYAQKDRFEEQEITVGKGEWKLPGTLTVPVGKGPFPVVVLVHGSGPNDRDETLGPNKLFRDLAWGLASRGVAVLRYEKRTRVHGAKLAGQRDLTVQHEVIDDVLAAVALARATAEIDPQRVFVVGHSLGGYLAPRILAGDASIAGAILLAGSARPMQISIVEQITYIARLDGTVSAEEAARIEQIEADLARLDAPSFSAASPPVFGVPASYWIDLKTYDPVATAKALDRPLLVLQGGRDYQVTRADFDLWKQGLGSRKDCTLRLYPELNHVFIAGSGPSTPDEYGTPGHAAVEVVNDIATWIGAAPPRKLAPK